VDDESFDGVLCRHGLMFVEEPVAAVREARRVLRPGGRYVAMTWDDREGVPFPPPGIPGPFSLSDPVLLADALRAGGLDDVEVVTVATPMRRASLEAWWELVPQLAGPLAAALAGMEEDVREAIRARALEYGAAAARSGDDGIELDGSVLVASGRR
jgi:SAM-dependent methyltransferase